MTDLKNVQTEDLVNRFNSLFEEYKGQLEEMKDLSLKIQKTREELLLIREELQERNVDPEEEAQNEG